MKNSNLQPVYILKHDTKRIEQKEVLYYQDWCWTISYKTQY